MEEEEMSNKIEAREPKAITQQQILLQEEQQFLLDKVRAGDKSAVPLLVDSWEDRVVNIAKKYQHSGLSMEQMIELGKQGLTKAALRDMGNTNNDSEFLRFGAWWSRQAILKWIAERMNLKRNA